MKQEFFEDINLDPFRLSKNKENIQGYLLQSSLKRLSDLKLQSDEAVNYELEFGVDPEGRYNIKGTLTTNLKLLCNDCTEFFTENVNINVNVYPVISESLINNYPKELDTILALDGKMSLIDFIEEEILLSLPMAANHQNFGSVCNLD